MSGKSEQVFEVLGFNEPKEVFLLPSRPLSEKYSLLLDGIFEYRNIIREGILILKIILRRKMIKIEGKIQNLKVEDSKILSIGNLGKQAANTALIGTLVGSTSLISNAPIMALAAKGRDGKTFRGEINGIRVVGQFTGVKFENNTPLIMVINEEQEDGYHFVYAVLDPKKGLLHMPYEMGRSKKKTYLSLFKTAIIMSVVFCILFSFIVILQYFNIEGISADRFKFNLIISNGFVAQRFEMQSAPN